MELPARPLPSGGTPLALLCHLAHVSGGNSARDSAPSNSQTHPETKTRPVERHSCQHHHGTSLGPRVNEGSCLRSRDGRYQRPGMGSAITVSVLCRRGVVLAYVLQNYARHAEHQEAARDLIADATGELRSMVGRPHQLKAGRVWRRGSQCMITEQQEGPARGDE